MYDQKGAVTFSGSSTLETDENSFTAKIRAQTEAAMDASADGKTVADIATKACHTPGKGNPDRTFGRTQRRCWRPGKECLQANLPSN